MRPCRSFRCPDDPAWVAMTAQGDLVDLCPDHAADGVEHGRFRWIIEGEAAWVRSDGLERVGDFIQEAAS